VTALLRTVPVMVKITYTKAAAAAVAAAALAGSGTVIAAAEASTPTSTTLATTAVHGTAPLDPAARAQITTTARNELASRGITPAPSSPIATITGTDTFRSQQWGYDAIKTPAANTASTGTGITVAVVDTGVARVADLSGKILPGKDFIATGDGTADPNGHGTGVASIIAATVGNSAGLAGIAPNTRILPVRVCDAAGACPVDTVAAGITFAADNGAQVINVSIGGASTPALTAAVAYAESKGVTVAASVGNSAEKGNPVLYPGGYDTVIGVAATDNAGNRAVFSETGPQVDIAAPGVGIVQAAPGDKYVLASGTSQASPHVAAVAALAKSYKNTLTPADIRALVTGTAADLGPAGRDDQFGAGLLDAAKAMTALGATVTNPGPPTPNPTAPAVLPVVTSAAPATGTGEGGSVVTVTGTNLNTATGVMFGDTPATSFTIVSPAKLTAVTPAGAGTVVIKVVNNTGTSVSATVKYTYRAPLGADFTDGVQAKTAGGTIIPVTVTGGTAGATLKDFTAAKITAKVGGLTAPVTWTGPAGLKVTAPATTKAGAAAIQLFHDGIAGPLSTAKVNYPAAVTAISPAKVSTAGGTTVTITGTGFLGVDTTDPSSVTFAGIPATSFTVKSATQIVAVTPPGTNGPAPVTVRTTAGPSAALPAARIAYRSVLGLTVADGTAVKASGGPVILEVTGGTIGTNVKEFTAEAITITAGTTKLPATYVDPTHVKVTLPASANQQTTLTIMHDGIAGGQVTIGYAPVITSLSATSDTIAGGKQVTIRAAGAGITAATAFRFGDNPATCTAKGAGTAMTFTCTVPPAGQAGPTWVSFTTATGTPSRFTAAATFSYTDLD
jgi:subtilisin family serine protease